MIVPVGVRVSLEEELRIPLFLTSRAQATERRTIQTPPSPIRIRIRDAPPELTQFLPPSCQSKSLFYASRVVSP